MAKIFTKAERTDDCGHYGTFEEPRGNAIFIICRRCRRTLGSRRAN